MSVDPKNYPAKPKKREPRPKGEMVYPTKPLPSEKRILDAFSKLAGVKITYHTLGPGLKIKGRQQGRGTDPVPEPAAHLEDGTLAPGFVSKFLSNAGRVELKAGQFTPDGRFTHNGTEFALDIKSRLDPATDTWEIINLAQKYALDKPLVLIAGSVPRLVDPQTKEPLAIPQVDLFGVKQLPAYVLDRHVRINGEMVPRNIYIIDWSRVKTRLGIKHD